VCSGMDVDPDQPRVHCSDARDLSMLSDGEANLVVTSPPYNLDVDYDSHDDDLPLAEYRQFIGDVFDEAYRVLASDGRMAVVVGIGTGQPVRDRPAMVKEAARSAGFELRGITIWDKCNSDSSSAWGSWRSASNPRQIFQHEHILVFYKNDPGRSEKRQNTLPKDEFMQFTKSVWHIKPERGVDDHPAPFPPEIPYRLVKLHSYPGDVVVDPFAGSGTAVAVANCLSREAIGVEISEEYADLARKRVDGFTWQEDLTDW